MATKNGEITHSRIRREAPRADYYALIQREGERPFSSKVVEMIYREEVTEAGDVLAYEAEGCVFDNDGFLTPLSEVEGLHSIMDPGETITQVLQPKKYASRRRRMRYLDLVGQAIGVVKGAM